MKSQNLKQNKGEKTFNEKRENLKHVSNLA